MVGFFAVNKEKHRENWKIMAGGGFTNGGQLKRAHLYEYKFTWYFFSACVVAALGGSLFGYDLGVSGNSLSPSLLFSPYF